MLRWWLWFRFLQGGLHRGGDGDGRFDVGWAVLGALVIVGVPVGIWLSSFSVGSISVGTIVIRGAILVGSAMSLVILTAVLLMVAAAALYVAGMVLYAALIVAIMIVRAVTFPVRAIMS